MCNVIVQPALKVVRLTLVQRADDWHISLENDSRYWEAANSPRAAIRKFRTARRIPDDVKLVANFTLDG